VHGFTFQFDELEYLEGGRLSRQSINDIYKYIYIHICHPQVGTKLSRGVNMAT
jgi:hypothetical protein